MHSDSICTLLAMAPPAAGGQQTTTPWYMQMFPFVLLIVVFYFVLIRPQQKKQKQVAEMLKTLRRGDKVVTTSGIIGVVISVKDRTVKIQSDDSKLEVTKSAIAEVLERSNDSSSES